ncbi:unnamed protein product [Rotaria sp. Silwood1]|nr:unnamed protein product [Rotaria sp. Silwood1]
MSLSTLSKLADDMNGDPDKTNFVLSQVSVTPKAHFNSTIDLDLYLPTAPIWSNLLLGNFSGRYGYGFDTTTTSCSCHFGRTTGVGQFSQTLRFENKRNNSWYNSTMQMLLASGHLVQTVRRVGLMDNDLTPDHIYQFSTALYYLVKRDEHMTEARRIINDEIIKNTINCLTWCGFEVQQSKPPSVLDFFKCIVAPTLLHYEIDLKISLATMIQCSSCSQISILNQQPCDYLLVQPTTTENTLPDVLTDLFGPVSTKNNCPKCLNNKNNMSSFSLMNCPKFLFIHVPTDVTDGTKTFKLTEHINLTSIMPNDLIFTYSYTRYTLQSFIIRPKNNDSEHYVTYARYRNDWYKLEDMKTTIINYETIFGEKAPTQSIILANFIRSSSKDVFSSALWNVFTNFSQEQPSLIPTLRLNDAIEYFTKYDPSKANVLDFAAAKSFTCSVCGKGNLLMVSLLVV